MRLCRAQMERVALRTDPLTQSEEVQQALKSLLRPDWKRLRGSVTTAAECPRWRPHYPSQQRQRISDAAWFRW